MTVRTEAFIAVRCLCGCRGLESHAGNLGGGFLCGCFYLVVVSPVRCSLGTDAWLIYSSHCQQSCPWSVPWLVTLSYKIGSVISLTLISRSTLLTLGQCVGTWL